MKILLHRPYEYQLVEDPGGGLSLSVTCGRAAVYEVTFPLTPAERAAYEREGEPAIALLAARVPDAPEKYRARTHE